MRVRVCVCAVLEGRAVHWLLNVIGIKPCSLFRRRFCSFAGLNEAVSPSKSCLKTNLFFFFFVPLAILNAQVGFYVEVGSLATGLRPSPRLLTLFKGLAACSSVTCI